MPVSAANRKVHSIIQTSEIRSKRPLVTYGKRKTANRGTETEADTVTKRRKTEDCTRGDGIETTLPVDKVVLPQPASPKRSGIMRYFKPAASSPSSYVSNTTRSVEAVPTRASSPPATQQPRQRRRLTTRPVQNENIRPQSDIQVHSDDDDVVDLGAEKCDADSDDEPLTLPVIYVRTDEDGEDMALTERDEKSLNSRSPERRAGTDSPPGTKVLRPKVAKRPSIQTTLSLSRSAGFTECRGCGLLYNPVHAEDVRYHAKQHAVFRQKNRKRSDLF
ncbi:uncharacterized protein E0L32_005083 [Thyridium curvatum]|uniref:N-acetyltransferase ESCO zinc-finger domain-containing protein n=1 Tax=Thyridium curvatum TaxID=1093900 RepID=A0A507BD67_9PEZI|nr:uncharacterized protein E0L32_005083 [Thyridium curvatum]TPX14688.1 hypothetical protein E0L32_005083 [Thyridium curvatum]